MNVVGVEAAQLLPLHDGHGGVEHVQVSHLHIAIDLVVRPVHQRNYGFDMLMVVGNFTCAGASAL